MPNVAKLPSGAAHMPIENTWLGGVSCKAIPGNLCEHKLGFQVEPFDRFPKHGIQQNEVQMAREGAGGQCVKCCGVVWAKSSPWTATLCDNSSYFARGRFMHSEPFNLPCPIHRACAIFTPMGGSTDSRRIVISREH